MSRTPATPAGDDRPAVNLHALTPRERNRLRLLVALRSRVYASTVRRSGGDVQLDRNLRHRFRLSRGHVVALSDGKATP